MIRPTIHILLHIVAPGLVAKLFYADRWRFAWSIMLLTMLVDLDHLLAEPIYAPGRCSIGFHPLHSYWAIACYLLLMLLPMRRIPMARLVGLGLVIHMMLDGLDCVWMSFD